MKILEALTNVFQREQTEMYLALPSDANMHWAGVLKNSGVRLIYTRHEHPAVAGAAVYARTKPDPIRPPASPSPNIAMLVTGQLPLQTILNS